MSLQILQPGLLITVQDLGRPNRRRWGVPLSGALDRHAHWLANRLVGNPPTSATLEITRGACALRSDILTLAALAGADCGWTLDDQPLRPWQAFLWRPGAILAGGTPTQGVRSYLALAGGIALPPVLGARSTLLGSTLPDPLNRPLRAGDVLPLLPAADFQQAGQGLAKPPIYPSTLTLPYSDGLHHNAQVLASGTWRISPHSNRMGYRLIGPPLLPAPPAIASLGIMPGVVQLPPDGQPIVLLADAQTTGGYPIIGVLPEMALNQLAQADSEVILNFIHISSAQLPHIHTQYQQMLDAPLTDHTPEWGQPI